MADGASGAMAEAGIGVGMDGGRPEGNDGAVGAADGADTGARPDGTRDVPMDQPRDVPLGDDADVGPYLAGTGGATGSGGSDVPFFGAGGTAGWDAESAVGGSFGAGGMLGGGGTGAGDGGSGAGGATGSGGVLSSGGVVGSGGIVGSGGVIGSGGTISTGGTTGTGGRTGSGGVIGTGGVQGTGGISGTGGSCPVVCLPPCTPDQDCVCGTCTLRWAGMTCSATQPCPSYATCCNGEKSKQCDATRLPASDTTNPGEFVLSADGLAVTDTITGLVWERDGGTPPSTFNDAKAHCAGLDIGGFTGFRLPGKRELMTIVDFTKSGPAIDQSANGFLNTPSAAFWTSAVSIPWYNNGTAEVVDFSSGAAKYWIEVRDSTTARVRCVR